MHDWQLLREYLDNGSQDAFARLVERHINLVYSTCLREVRDAALAEDVTQVVFLLLVKKAPGLREGTVLSGWLFQTARFISKDALKQEARRQQREQKAAQEMINETDAGAQAHWEEIEPLLHNALSSLGTEDRDAILIRFFENRSLKETGAVLGVSEEAARKRVTRAVEKLRRYFSRHGLMLSGAVLTGLISSHAVRAAPANCTASILQATASVAGGALLASLLGAGVLALYEGTAKLIFLSQLKKAAGVLAVVALGTVGVIQIAQRAPANLPHYRTFSMAQQRTSVENRATPLVSARTVRPAVPARAAPVRVAANDRQASAHAAGRMGSGVRRTDGHTPGKAVLREHWKPETRRADLLPLSQIATNREVDTQAKIRGIILETNRKLKLAQKLTQPVKAKVFGALLGIGAAYGAVGAMPAKAQPPETAQPIVNNTTDDATSKAEPRVAIAAAFVEMSSQDLDALGINFVAPAPTVLAARTVVTHRIGGEDPKPVAKSDPGAAFAFGEVQGDFQAMLDTLTDQKRARIVYGQRLVNLANRRSQMPATASIPITLAFGSGGDNVTTNQAQMAKSNLYLKIALGLDVTASINANDTLTLKLHSPVRMYLQAGSEKDTSTITTLAPSTVQVEVITRRSEPAPLPGPGVRNNITGRVSAPPRITISPSQFTTTTVEGGTYFLGETKGTVMRDEVTTSTRSTETVLTLKDNGTIAMRGIRAHTMKQGDKDITLWSYVPTLGRLLNNDETTEPEKELVVFITARVVRP